MTIWLLALLLIASLGALGYRQGALRVGCSFIGILLGTILAPPLGHLLKPLFGVFGVKNPLLLWVLGPLVVFIIISALSKVGGLALHQKVDVFYKYRAGDLRLALWERLNQRVGLCLGLLNGTAYLVLIVFIIYAFSYWTVQMATSEQDPRMVRILNRLGTDLQSTGFISVARAMDRLPDSYYDAADTAGILYNNPLAEARLVRYPGLLAIGERPEFQDLGNDQEFSKLRLGRAPIREVLEYSKVQTIIDNPDLLKLIWTTMAPDWKDLQNFLATLKSPKYDPERILGRWNFDVGAAMAAFRKAFPSIPSGEMQKRRKWMASTFAKSILVAMPDGQVLFKNAPPLKLASTPAAAATPQNVQGQWKRSDGKYQLSLSWSGRQEALLANVEGDRLIIAGEGSELALNRED